MALSAAILAAARPAAGPSISCFAAALRLQVSSRTFASSSQCQLQQEPSHQESNSLANSSSSSSSGGSSNNSSTSVGSSTSKEGYDLVYEGFFAKPHKRLKYASLLNTFASFAAAPLIISYSSASPIARVAVTTSVLAFAVITTGGLHWFTQPYVHQLWYNKQTDTVRAQRLKFFGGTRWFEFPASSVCEPTGYHPLASFKADGKVFYIDLANFRDTALMERLMPWAVQQQKEAQQQQADSAADGPSMVPSRESREHAQ